MRKKTHEEYIKELKEINQNIIPLEEYIGNNVSILHKCLIDGHEWKNRPGNILHGQGCPKCGRIRTIIKQRKTHEQYIEDLANSNHNIEVLEHYINNATKIMHKCKIDGYKWEATPSSVLKNGCPKCANRPHITHNDYCEMLKNKNPNIEVIEQYINMDTNILHKCKIDGYVWNLKPLNAVKGRGCPVCSNKVILEGYNDLQTTHPHIAKNWNLELNKIKPTEVSFGSNKSVWWTCPECNYNYKAIVSNRVYNDLRCPRCCSVHKKSVSELKVYYYVKKYFNDAISGYKDDNISELDIFIPSLNIGIEYDGEKWHKETDRDIKKDIKCKEVGIEVIRIREKGCPEYISESKKISLNSYNQKALENSIINVLKILGVHNPKVDFKNDHNEIYGLVYENKKENSIAILYPDLIDDWDYEQNGNLTPYNISFGSHKKVWWKCKNCGHKWYTRIYIRTKGRSKCPNCHGKNVGG